MTSRSSRAASQYGRVLSSVRGDQVVDPHREAPEPELVGRQDLVGIDGADGGQRVQKVGQRVHLAIEVNGDIRRDAGEQVVAREQEPALLLVEADVARG